MTAAKKTLHATILDAGTSRPLPKRAAPRKRVEKPLVAVPKAAQKPTRVKLADIRRAVANLRGMREQPHG